MDEAQASRLTIFMPVTQRTEIYFNTMDYVNPVAILVNPPLIDPALSLSSSYSFPPSLSQWFPSSSPLSSFDAIPAADSQIVLDLTAVTEDGSENFSPIVKLTSIANVAHPWSEMPSINAFQPQFVRSKILSHCAPLLSHDHRYLPHGGAPVALANLNLQFKIPIKNVPQVIH